MAKKILKALRSNLGYKILSVLIAILIWYAVVNINDPIETGSYTVHVTVTNESYISSGKQVYHIDDEYKTVTVYVKGNRSDLRHITADNITVTADLTQIVDMDRDPIMVPLSASCPGISPTNITLSRNAIPITIENIASKAFPVSVNTGDSVPGSNYEVGTLTPNPEQVVINGPESIVNTIDSVVATIDVTGMTQDGTKKAALTVLDKNSEPISDETIADDLTFDGGVPNITVAVDLWRKQSNVRLNVQYSGQPANGYHVTSVSTTPETITVVGNDTALASLAAEANTITISDPDISVAGAKDDVKTDITLSDKLPEGLRLTANAADTVSVDIAILSDESRELSIDVDDIVTDNLADNLTVSYDQTNVKLRVSGSTSALSSLRASDITASIDLKGKTEGDYSVLLNVDLPSGLTLTQAVSIQVHLKAKAVETSSSSEGGKE